MYSVHVLFNFLLGPIFACHGNIFVKRYGTCVATGSVYAGTIMIFELMHICISTHVHAHPHVYAGLPQEK